MAITVEDENLGHATAYAYAKSKGYAGTEEEFAEDLKKSAEYADNAAASATSASESATNAANSATAAGNAQTAAESAKTAAQSAQTAAESAKTSAQSSATSAGNSATAASGSASNASASASSAASSASSASSSASSASASATAAGNSATSAGTSATNAAGSATSAASSATAASGSATDAQNAKTAAQNAQTAAEAARDAAQGYAESANPNAKADVITNTASGAIASFTDGAAMPVKGLTVNVDAVQSGSGDPSPTNVRPISGWDAVKVTRAGKNLFDLEHKTGFTGYISSGVITIGSSGRMIIYLPCKPNTIYTASRLAVATDERFYFGWTDVLPAAGVTVHDYVTAPTHPTVGDKLSLTITTGTTAKYLVMWAYWASHTEALDTLQVELGSSASDYEAYNGVTKTIDFDQTIYGGTLNVDTGVLKINRGVRIMDGDTYAASSIDQVPADSEYTHIIGKYRVLLTDLPNDVPMNNDTQLCSHFKWLNYTNRKQAYPDQIYFPSSARNVMWASNTYTTLEEFNQYLADQYTNGTPVTLVWPLATETEVQLTAEEVTTLLGQNNIFADTGNVDVVYGADTKLYVDKKVSASQSLMELIITANHEDSMKASKAYISGNLLIVNGVLYKATTSIASGATLTVGTNITATTVAAELASLS